MKVVNMPQEKSISSAGHYYNTGQLRTELWTELKERVYSLARKRNRGELENDKAGIIKLIKELREIEQYFAFPGNNTLNVLVDFLKKDELQILKNSVKEVLRLLVSEDYRHNPETFSLGTLLKEKENKQGNSQKSKKKYFEVLVVDNLSSKEEHSISKKLDDVRDEKDVFVYQLVFVKSFQDTLIALVANPNIQACVIRYEIPYRSKNTNGILKPFLASLFTENYEEHHDYDLGILLGQAIRNLRPELDIYYVTDNAVNNLPDAALKTFQRIFYRSEDTQELHLSIIRGIKDRYKTPFYTALKEYSQKPTGVFHAMPISRGNSIFKSNWIDDFGDFYGRNLFLAETSSTTGGLDSLLQPTGPLKEAQELASKAFGSKRTYFATNGTSTSNKIVLQALIEPGDVVLIDRDCHKSHHYGMVLAGAYVTYLDSYPLQRYSMYGAVPLFEITERLHTLKKAGRLDNVKMLLLTNCTFDGLVYNVERVMEQVLAIKPDMIFLWDEAWFGFAAFTPTYRQRTAMYVANKLCKKYKTAAYKEQYKQHLADLKKKGGDQTPTMPNPELVKIRVYSTQSTHKTLSSFRQGSMIHIYDEEFERKAETSFHEAYMTHTSTSANYQILASLDVGRRQVSFEGYELVEKSIEMAMLLRAKISDHPKLKKYFKILTVKDIIPDQYRQSGLSEYYNTEKGWQRLETAWAEDDFVLDPTKINMHIGATGVDGDTFKNKYLMDQFHIQINKTSRNSVLFMTNIGTTRSSVSYLISALVKIAEQIDVQFDSLNPEENRILQDKIYSLTEQAPPLPDFSYFHDSFRAVAGIPGGKMREAYFLAYKEEKCEYVKLSSCKDLMQQGRQVVSSAFIIPYPPGFPVLVPGQVMTVEILDFLQALDVKEIHGYRADLGLRIFTEAALNRHQSGSSLMGASAAMSGMVGMGGNGRVKKAVPAKK
ncbi:ornithine decarboxylase [uncultured Imperialibacter sp.]|uniref:aminotransferase class I/II-fold pyridoxal phosphate-dependent enzyme n=1 Tax=uncultured Imperialibacter sp. TaxID=1672639 RepID=UPI0030D6F137|tara:strand:- start:1838 stop:4654 length:2817 start_codon:yes stop_codon:yes gene_type:complete